MCVQGKCRSSSLAPELSCPFGDDVIVNNHLTMYTDLPKAQMSCEDVFNFISVSLNEFPVAYCADSRFKAACCDTCKSMKL